MNKEGGNLPSVPGGGFCQNKSEATTQATTYVNSVKEAAGNWPHAIYDPVYVTRPGWANPQRRKEISEGQGQGGGGGRVTASLAWVSCREDEKFWNSKALFIYLFIYSLSFVFLKLHP